MPLLPPLPLPVLSPLPHPRPAPTAHARQQPPPLDATQVTREFDVLNARVTTLEAANTELKGLQKAAIAQIHQLGVTEYESRVAALQTELEVQRKRNDEISQLAWQRERWAEEHVENERRAFAESLRAAQLDFSRQHRDATHSMLEARSRLVAVEERSQAIRHAPMRPLPSAKSRPLPSAKP